MRAARIVRGATGRDVILFCGYHGWHDWYISVTNRSAGIPDCIKNLTFTFDYNQIESLQNALDEDVACVIMEPFVFDPPKSGFLFEVQELCKKNGSLFILDEMWSGFRIALGGAQEFFKIKPDLAVYSKAVANGMPISILTGKKEILKRFEEDVFFFTTFGGEALSLAATQATIDFLIKHRVPLYLNEIGEYFKDNLNKTIEFIGAQKYFQCKGYPCRTTLQINSEVANPLIIKTYIQQEMIRMGILWQGNHNIMFAHKKEHLDYVLEAYFIVLKKSLELIQEGNIQNKLRGKPLEPIFRRVDNFNTKPIKK